jgi:hypothetical protein
MYELPACHCFARAILQSFTDDMGNLILVCTLSRTAYLIRRAFYREWME